MPIKIKSPLDPHNFDHISFYFGSKTRLEPSSIIFDRKTRMNTQITIATVSDKQSTRSAITSPLNIHYNLQSEAPGREYTVTWSSWRTSRFCALTSRFCRFMTAFDRLLFGAGVQAGEYAALFQENIVGVAVFLRRTRYLQSTGPRNCWISIPAIRFEMFTAQDWLIVIIRVKTVPLQIDCPYFPYFLVLWELVKTPTKVCPVGATNGHTVNHLAKLSLCTCECKL